MPRQQWWDRIINYTLIAGFFSVHYESNCLQSRLRVAFSEAPGGSRIPSTQLFTHASSHVSYLGFFGGLGWVGRGLHQENRVVQSST